MKYWFVFKEDNVLLERLPNGSFTIPQADTPPIENAAEAHVLRVSSMADGTEVRAVSVNTFADNPRYEFCGLRASYYKLPLPFYLKAGKCRELLYWDKNTRYCGACGAPMRRGDEVLLVHARNFKGDFYGLVAGFVETGETLEEAVHREVMEETGLRIRNLRYFGSQPWPYPSGLMVGFNADYAGGDIHLQREELSRGAWFKKDNLPTIPEKLSARKILDDWLLNGKSTD